VAGNTITNFKTDGVSQGYGNDTGMYAPLTDSGSPAPGGTTLEKFVIGKNTIGPLTRENKYIEVRSEGTVTTNENTLLSTP
jgi:hypothetical protein